MLSSHRIIYHINPDIPNSGNELKSGLVNVIGVIGGILGIKSNVIMNGIGDLPSLVNRLKDLFTLINPDNQYSLNLEKSDPTQPLNSSQLQAFVRITVASPDSRFNFLLNSYVGHGSVKLDHSPPRIRREIIGGIRDFTDYFFPNFPGQNPYSSVFSFAEPSNNLGYKISRAVRVFGSTTDQFLKSAIGQSIANLAGKAPLADREIAQDFFKKMVFACRFNDVTYELVRGVIPVSEHLPVDLRKVTMHIDLSESDQFDMAENNGYTEEITLSGVIGDIVGRGGLSPALKVVHLTTLWNLNRLNFRDFTELRELSITCNNYGKLELPPVRPPVKVKITRLR
jgi:hypothetical protein